MKLMRNKLYIALILLAIGTTMVIVSFTVSFKYQDIEHPPVDRFLKELENVDPANIGEIGLRTFKFFSEGRIVQKENKTLKYLILFSGITCITTGSVLLVLSTSSEKTFQLSRLSKKTIKINLR